MRKTTSPRIHFLLLLLCLSLGALSSVKNDVPESPPLSVAFGNATEKPEESTDRNAVQNNYSESTGKGNGKATPKDEENRGSGPIRPGSPLPENATGGVVGTSETDPGEWSESTFEIHRRLVSLGYDEDLARYMIDECKEKADNPRHCVITAGFIGKAESQAGRTAHRNNVFGFRKTRFPDTKKAVDSWIRNYTKKWHKTKGPAAFYSPKPGLPPTRYCVDEVQKDGTVLPYCPNGYRNAMIAYKVLVK